MSQSELLLKALSFPEFVSLFQGTSSSSEGHSSSLRSRELVGFLTWRQEAADYVFFGVSPFVCPSMPIHKDKIERIMPNATAHCAGPPGQMWSGIIALKEGAESGLLQVDRSLLHALPLADDVHADRRTFVWFSLESNLQRADGWLWGRWSDEIEEACRGLGLRKPLVEKDLIQFWPVGTCNGDRIFLAEIPRSSG